MKLRSLLFLIAAFVYAGFIPASAQYIVHVAGNDSPSVFNGYRGDGTMAVDALVMPWSACSDAAGNLYVADEDAANWKGYIRKIAAGTGIITTIGGGGASINGNNVPALGENLWEVNSLCMDIDGNLLIADGSGLVRKINLATGIITTIAGGGMPSFIGNGGPATAAYIGDVSGVAVDGAGNIYLTDLQYNVVRKVTRSTGIINTIAGLDSTSGFSGYAGDDGPASAALLNNPISIFVDSAGNVYISDAGNNVVRKVDAATGTIHTVAGIRGGGYYSGDGMAATAAALNYPSGTVVDHDGNIFIADAGNYLVRRVDGTTGVITTYAGNRYGYGLGFSGGHLSVHNVGDGGLATEAHLEARSLSLDNCGNLLISDGLWLRAVTPTFPSTGMLCSYPVTFDSEPNRVSSPVTSGGLRVAPNPGDGIFSVVVPGTVDEPVQITITDMLGRQVLQAQGFTNHEARIKLDAAAGIYTLNAITAHGRKTTKVVVR